MALDLVQEGLPLGAGFSVGHEKVRAVFVAEVSAIRVADAFPVLVWDDSIQGDFVALHQIGSEAGGAVQCGGAGVSAIFAHFDADRFTISGAFVVGMLSLLIGGERLVDGMGIDRKMPSKVAQ